LGFASPCGLAAGTGTALRFLNGAQAAGGLINASNNLANGNYGAAALDAAGVFGNLGSIFKACFVAGTPLLTPEGSKPIEQFVSGDSVLSKDEFNAAGEVRALAVFETISPVLNLHVGGRIIGTTSEHPFWVEGEGWTAAKDLRIGDVLVSHNGLRRILEGVANSGLIEKVYNIAVEDDHTYFVGGTRVGLECLGA